MLIIYQNDVTYISTFHHRQVALQFEKHSFICTYLAAGCIFKSYFQALAVCLKKKQTIFLPVQPKIEGNI